MLMLSVMVVGLWIPAAGLEQDVLAEARTLIADGSAGEAVRVLEAALSSGAADEKPVRLMLAEAQVYDGRASAAIRTLDALDTRGDYDTALAMGRTYLAWANELAMSGANNDDVHITAMDAHPHLRRAYELAPEGSSDAARELGNFELYTAGDHDRAKQIADERLGTSPDDGEMHLLRGCALVFDYWNARESGDKEATDELFSLTADDLLAADELLPPERTEPWAQLAWLYDTHGRRSDAVRAAIEIVDRDPNGNLDTLWDMANRFSLASDWNATGLAMEKLVNTSAREVYLRIRRSENTDETATRLSWSVVPFVNNGDQATAYNILKAIVAAQPSAPIVWNNYAVMCENTSRFEDAATAYEKAIELDPTDPRPYNDLGKVLAIDLKRDQERAKTLFAKCIEIAEKGLADEETPDDRRQYLAQARDVAQQNMSGGGGGGGSSSGQGGGLLDRLRNGLRNLNVPGEGDGDGDGGDAGGDDDGASDSEGAGDSDAG